MKELENTIYNISKEINHIEFKKKSIDDVDVKEKKKGTQIYENYKIQAETSSKKVRPSDIVFKVRIGMKIKHKAFGVGIVHSIDNGIIEVQFGYQIKKFQFPSAFLQGFLEI